MGSIEGWVGVDLDGTLAHYENWVDVEQIGEPIPAMIIRVKRWLDHGYEVRIFTARISHNGSPEQLIRADLAELAIEKWCKKHIGVILPITNVKDLEMLELWDDRVVQVITNEGTPMGPSRLPK